MAPHHLLLIPADELGWHDLRAILTGLRSVRLREAATAQQALEIAPSQPFELMLCGLTVAGEPAIPLLAALGERSPESLKVVFTSVIDAPTLRLLAGLPIHACLVWADFPRQYQLRAAVSALLNGVMVSSPTVADLARPILRVEPNAPDRAYSLSAREQAVLNGLAAGLSRDEIALREGMSRRTVNRIVSALEEKLDAPSPFLLGLRAGQYRLIS